MHHISIIKQHEGHLLGKHKWSGSKLICDLQVEPLVDIDYESHDYNLHFNFGLHNHSEEAKTITVIIKVKAVILALAPASPGAVPKFCVVTTGDCCEVYAVLVKM